MGTWPTERCAVVAAVGRLPRDAAVVHRAVQEAAYRAGAVTILTVDDGEGEPAEQVAAAEALARRLRPEVEVRTAVRPGPVVSSIVAASRATDLVVLGCEGSSPVAKLVRGAVTANVAARALSAVEVVPVPGEGPTLTAPRTRVVATMSETDHLEDLADIAFAEARRCGAPVEFWYPDDGGCAPSATAGRLALRRRLQAALAPWLRGFPDVVCDVAVFPAAGPDATARMLVDTDVAVTLRGRGATSWGRPDGTTRVLIERSRCPVIVVPPRERRRSRVG